jgi:glyoxylate reductase
VSKPSVFVSRKIPQAGLELLRRHFDVTVWPYERPPTSQELVDNCRDKDALVCLLTERVDAAILAASPKLKIVANVAVGYDNLNVAAGTAAGVVMTNTPGVLDDTTADLAFALLMAAARRIVEGDQLVRSGMWGGWGIMQLLGHDVHHAKLGIVGFGRIGRGVAKRARGFEMRVSYHDALRAPAEAEQEFGVTYVSFEEILSESDFVSVHVPLMPSTHHLINGESLNKMKPTAILINTSRGPVIDENALVEALRNGTIAGAGLDVYEHEPRLARGLTELHNVVLLPHIASASHATRGKMAKIAAENVVAYFEGRTPPTALNPEVFSAARS